MDDLADRIANCRLCPRLVSWREQVARDKRPAFAGESYWGRPVPGFGDPAARLLVVGLAPAAHGANRTGRMFTGDRSGDWLFRSLHHAGFASQAESRHRGDGLALWDCWVTAAVRCAPPANRPDPSERDACRRWLDEEFDRLTRVRVVVALGGFAWDAVLRLMAGRGEVLRPRPQFAHGVRAGIADRLLLGSYHPSQQNTFTGRLTEGMLDAIFASAQEAISDLG